MPTTLNPGLYRGTPICEGVTLANPASNARRLAGDRSVRGSEGFTLAEVLAVVVIIGILAAVAIPAGLAQKQKGVETSMASDVVAVAVHLQSSLAGWRGTPPNTMIVSTEGSLTATPSWVLSTPATTPGGQPAVESAGPLTPGNSVEGTVWENGAFCVRVTNESTPNAIRFLSTDEQPRTGLAGLPADPSADDVTSHAAGSCPASPPDGAGTLPPGVEANVPPPPAGLRVVSDTPNSVTINRTSPFQATNPETTSYLILVPGQTPVEVDVVDIDGWVSPATVQPGSSRVTVRGINSNGAGAGYVQDVDVYGSILQDGTRFLGDVSAAHNLNVTGAGWFYSPATFGEGAMFNGNINAGQRALIGVDTTRNANGYFAITPLDWDGNPVLNKQLYYDVDLGKWSFEGDTNTGGWVFDNHLTPHNGTPGQELPGSELRYHPATDRWQFGTGLGVNGEFTVTGQAFLNGGATVRNRLTIGNEADIQFQSRSSTPAGRLWSAPASPFHWDPPGSPRQFIHTPTDLYGTELPSSEFYFNVGGNRWEFENGVRADKDLSVGTTLDVGSTSSFTGRATFWDGIRVGFPAAWSQQPTITSESFNKQLVLTPVDDLWGPQTDKQLYWNGWTWAVKQGFTIGSGGSGNLSVFGSASVRDGLWVGGPLTVDGNSTFGSGRQAVMLDGNINIGCQFNIWRECTAPKDGLSDGGGNLFVGRNITAWGTTSTRQLSVGETSTFGGVATFWGGATVHNQLRVANEGSVQLSGRGQTSAGRLWSAPASPFHWDPAGSPRQFIHTPADLSGTELPSSEFYFNPSTTQWTVEGMLLVDTVTNGHGWTDLTVSVPGVAVVSGNTPDGTTSWRSPAVRRMADGTVRLRGNLNRTSLTVAAGAVTPTQYGALCLVPLTTIPNTVGGLTYRPSHAALVSAGATNRLEMTNGNVHTTWGDMNVLVRSDGTVSLVFPSSDGNTWRQSDCVDAWDVMTTSHFYLDGVTYLADGV